MIRIELSDREVRVLELRKNGKTFREIAEILGMNHYQQGQGLYRKALKKLRTYRDIQKNDPSLLSAASKQGFNFAQLSRLYSIMVKNGIANRYKAMSSIEIAETEGIGEEYLKVLEISKRIS